MALDLIGTETWACDGWELTPRMRQDILMTAVEMYETWEARGTSYEWDKVLRRLVETDANPVTTMGEFLDEATGERHSFIQGDFAYYGDELHDWLVEYLYCSWEGSFYEDDEDDRDPVGVAGGRVCDWLEDMRIEDVLAWHSDVLHPERRAADWRTAGF